MAGTIPDLEKLRQFTLGILSESESRRLEEFLESVEGPVAWESVDQDKDPLVATLRSGTTVELNQEVDDLLLRLLKLHQSPIESTVSSLFGLLDPPIGSEGIGRVGQYIVHEIIGQGGAGVVFRAFDTALHRTVALKFLLDSRYANPTQRARLEREALILAKLAHPGIVAIHEVGHHRDRVFLSLEYLKGGTLASLMKGDPQPIRECAEIAKQLAEAVGFAHQLGIVHRDLKPGNILLASDDLHSAKIADFGLARRIDETGLTETGVVLGTPGYLAPEQTRQKSDAVGPTVDVYSLGAVLYELLTGRPPFRGETILDTLEQARTSEPVLPRNLRKKIPQDLETIVLKCLQRDPLSRYATADDLAADLGRYLSGKPIFAKKAGSIKRLAKWGARNPVAVALIGVSVFSVVILAVMQMRTFRALELAKSNATVARASSLRADDNYRKARTAIQKIVQHANDPGSGDIPRVRDLRRQQQNDALSFYLDIAKQEENTIQVRRDVALATYEAATIHAGFDENDQAYSLFEKSLKLAQELLSENPLDVEIRRLQIDSMTGLTVVSRENALQILTESCRLAERLVSDFPDEPISYGAEATAWNNRGHNNFTEGNLEEAERCFRKAVESREQQLQRDPSNRDVRVALASNCSNLQRILSSAGKNEGTAPLAERAAELLEKLYEDDPTDAFTICRLANQRVNYAYEQYDAGKGEKAVKELGQSIEALEKIHASDSTNSDVITSLFNAHGARAELCGGLERYETAVESWRRVVALVPQDQLFWRKTGLLDTLIKAGSIEEAIALLKELEGADKGICTSAIFVDLARSAVRCKQDEIAMDWLRKAKDKSTAEEWKKLRQVINDDLELKSALQLDSTRLTEE